jgi:hypothetical protein
MPAAQEREPRNCLWLRASIELDDLCRNLEAPLLLAPFEYDAENVFEWGEAKALDGRWEIDVSRKHDDGAPLPEEPYHVMLKGEHPGMEHIARTLARVAKAPVHWGTIKYLGGNEYSYHATSTAAV